MKKLDYSNHRKKREDIKVVKKASVESQGNKLSLEMNLLDTSDYAPINLWINLASVSGISHDYITDMHQAIL